MREERREWRERIGSARLMAQEAQRTGKLVIEAGDISFDRGERPIVRELALTIMRGDKLGIIGPNGCGKTTLLNILLGRIAPLRGSVRHGTHLKTQDSITGVPDWQAQAESRPNSPDWVGRISPRTDTVTLPRGILAPAESMAA